MKNPKAGVPILTEKILVIGVDTSNLLILQEALESYTVLYTRNSLEAIALMERGDDYSLLVLDIDNLGVEDFQSLDSRESESRQKNRPAIVLVGDETGDRESIDSKFTYVEYLSKPLQRELLIAQVELQMMRSQVDNLRQRIGEQSTFYRALFKQAPIGIAIAEESTPTGNSEDDLFRVNPIFEQITGRTNGELIHLGWSKISHPDDIEEDLWNYRKLLSNEIKSYNMEKRYLRPDGSIVWVDMTMGVLDLPGMVKRRYVCLIQDITARKRAEEELAYNHEHDVWTGLYNRNYFENKLKQDLANPDIGRIAMISVNLSAVGTLSMRYGFNYSQALMKRIAKALLVYDDNSHIRLFNTDESRFVFSVNRYHDRKVLIGLCTDISGTLKALLSIERVGWGIGVIEIDGRNADDVDQLLRNLLIASEYSLTSTVDHFDFCFFDEHLKAQIHREEQITNSLQEIAEGVGSDRLLLHFQPILDLRLNKIGAFEALARLHLDELGMVSPLEFIPIAEKSKLIIPLGEQIIHKACLFLRRLQQMGYGSIRVSINISPIQLLAKDFVQVLLRIIADTKVEPSSIALEITETVVATEFQLINSILGRLKELGIRSAMDDFGTGYSSLSRERELHIDTIKIDKYFVDKLLVLKPEQSITGDIVSMAHRMGYAVVAEGVEHETQFTYLKNTHCDMIQGYYISRPLDAQHALKFLSSPY